ncbi:MAG: hypothetical protein HYW78_01045 [Parcubacteria group bacterium]|nr:hypothetical protein [Parcubacteria group bacterium]
MLGITGNKTKTEKEFEYAVRKWSRAHSSQEVDALWKELWSEVTKFNVYTSPMEIISQFLTVKSIQEEKSITTVLVGLVETKTVKEFIDFLFTDKTVESLNEIIYKNGSS